jgi:hypothetical protein
VDYKAKPSRFTDWTAENVRVESPGEMEQGIEPPAKDDKKEANRENNLRESQPRKRRKTP